MDDSLLVGFAKPFGDLAGNIDRLLYTERPYFNLFFERLPLDKFHRDKGLAIGFINLMDYADMWMIEGGGSLCLLNESLFSLFILR